MADPFTDLPTPPPPRPLRLTVNGAACERHVAPRRHLVDFLRQDLGLKGSHLGCEHGACGACTVELDGRIVRGCLTLAVQADGARVRTIEGLSADGDVADLQQAFVRHNALQCGFCTPGMVMAAKELLETRTQATRAEVREWISGNYCRCTGYHAIVDAICETLEQRPARAGGNDADGVNSISGVSGVQGVGGADGA